MAATGGALRRASPTIYFNHFKWEQTLAKLPELALETL
jgi:hypothetical protein